MSSREPHEKIHGRRSNKKAARFIQLSSLAAFTFVATVGDTEAAINGVVYQTRMVVCVRGIYSYY